MKNSVLYIVGAVVLLGGGAFLFLRNKKMKDASKLADLEKATLTPAPVPAPSQTPTQDVGTVIKTAQETQAEGLATQIFGLKTQRVALSSQLKPLTGGTVFGGSSNVLNFATQSKINVLTSKINSLNNQLKQLGYKEVDGKAVKL